MCTCNQFSTNNRNLQMVRIRQDVLDSALASFLSKNNSRFSGMLIHGKSKVGKTLLVEEALRFFDYERILISGSAINSKDALLDILAYALRIDANNKQFAVQYALLERDYCIVIDDIHFIQDFDVLEATLQYIKAYLDYARFIMIGINSEYVAQIESYDQFIGRIAFVEIDDWTTDDLATIGEEGFQYLDIPGDQLRLRELSQESIGSPFIMQTVCRVLCDVIICPHLMKYNILRPVTSEDVQYACYIAATQYMPHAYYHKLISIDYCENKSLQRLRTGEYKTINAIIWQAIAGDNLDGAMPPLSYPVEIPVIRSRFNDLLPEGEMYRNEQIESALKFMIKQYEIDLAENSNKSRHDSIIRFDDYGRFCVNDPFMLFYARHYSR